jgi:hypothetical protein
LALRYASCSRPGRLAGVFDRRIRVRVRRYAVAIEVGARAEHVALRRRWDWAPRPLRLRLGRAYVGEYVAFACPVIRRTRTVVICEGDF